MNPGIHQLTMREYLDLQALSGGDVNRLLTLSPAEAWHDSAFNPARPDDHSKESDIGTIVHACLLEGGTDKLRVFNPADFPNAKGGGVATGWTNKAIREARDDARANGEVPLLVEQFEGVRAMVKAAQSYLADSDLAGCFEDGKPEQTLIWTETHDDGEVLCKARPDWISERYLIHVKTTATNVNPRAFSRLAANSGYDISLMWYLRGLNTVLPDNEVGHYIFAQSQNPPHACKLFDLTAARADVAEKRIERAIGVWARCLARNSFPAYSGDVYSIDLTPWELAQAEEDMLTDEELSGGLPL